MTAIVHTAQTLLRRFGLDIRRHYPASVRRANILTEMRIGTILDVGANVGQFATELRESGFEGWIVSFEPLNDAFRALSDTASGDARWACRRLAASDRSGRTTMNVAANSASSSLLPTAALHDSVAPFAVTVGEQEVDLGRLDEQADLEELPGPWMLKMDVQGHEAAVLDGAEGILDRVAVVECELSVRPLYDGAPLLPEMLAGLARHGFELVGLEPGMRSPSDGSVLQYDGLFRSTRA